MAEEEIAPRQTRERLDEEASSQSAPMTQEPLLTALAVRHRRGSSRSRHVLVAKLARLATVTTNMRAISRQNATMQELLGRMQGQLANSSPNEEGILPKREVGVDMVANYATHQMTWEIVVPPNYSRGNHIKEISQYLR